MKICHLCLSGPVTDGWNYQDNVLPKFHRKMGYDTEIITSQWVYAYSSDLIKTEKNNYLNENNIIVHRLKIKNNKSQNYKLKRYMGLYEQLEKSEANILFVHGCQFLDMDTIVRYVKQHNEIKVYVDNHADFSNSATNWFSKNILHKLLWRHTAQMVEPYTTKFFGVLPARVDFLKDVYRLSKDKCELLVMGADDEKVEAADISVKRGIRKKYNIDDDDFLIMTGGKIDAWKTQTLLLMEAVRNIENTMLKLIVFGSVTEELRSKVETLCDGDKIQYIGWIQAEESYKYFAACDLAVFPGRHSVFWEQVVAQKIPLICKYWAGTTHVDIGGNIKFIYEDSSEEIQMLIAELINDSKIYQSMKTAAADHKHIEFLYSRIAEKSIMEC